jgi:hypothetical protein
MLCLMLVILFAAQACWAGQALAAQSPPASDNRERAGGALLIAGAKALDSLEESHRSRARSKRVRALVGGVIFAGVTAGLALAGGAAAMAGTSVSAEGLQAVLTGYLAVGAGAAALGGNAAAAEQSYHAAIQNAGEYRGWYVARAVPIAPQEALWFASSTKDVAIQSKVLGAVLAAAAMYAPEIAEPAATSMVAALRQGKARDDGMLTAGTALQACGPLGAEHPAVTTCVEYIKATLSDEGLRKYPKGASKAANALAYFRPAEASRLSAKLGNPKDRCEVLISAANGALFWGDAAASEKLLHQARAEANSVRDVSARIDALASLAVSEAAGARREALTVDAVAAARATGRDATRLVRRVAVRLAPVDLSLALSIRTPDDRPIRDVKFARELTAAALQSPASEAHVALLRDLPRSADLASEFTALASTLSQSQEPSVRAAGVRAATTALEVAPQVRDSRARGSVTVLSLAVIGASDPELAQRSLPNTRDSGLLAQSQLRLARVIAQKAAAEPDEAAKRTLMASARKLLRSGLAAVPLPREGDLPQPALTEVGPATFAAATVDPEDALTAAERAPHSFARLEALIGCGLAGHLAGSASVESILTKAVAEAQRLPDGESAEVMAARALALQALVQPLGASRGVDDSCRSQQGSRERRIPGRVEQGDRGRQRLS